jgi:hypothetical protein
MQARNRCVECVLVLHREHKAAISILGSAGRSGVGAEQDGPGICALWGAECQVRAKAMISPAEAAKLNKAAKK